MYIIRILFLTPNYKAYSITSIIISKLSYLSLIYKAISIVTTSFILLKALIRLLLLIYLSIIISILSLLLELLILLVLI